MADSDYVPTLFRGLLDPAYYSAQRAALLQGKQALTKVEPGSPPWNHAQKQTSDEALEPPSTTHLSIVDKEGYRGIAHFYH